MDKTYGWAKIATVGAITLAAGAGVYYALQQNTKKSEAKKVLSKTTSDTTTTPVARNEPKWTREKVIEKLKDYRKVESDCRVLTNQFIHDFVNQNKSPLEVYKILEESLPKEYYNPGPQMKDLDDALIDFPNDPEIRELLDVFWPPKSAAAGNENKEAEIVEISTLVEINKFIRDLVFNMSTIMLDKVEKGTLNPTLLSLTIQTYVGARVVEKYNYGPDDIEHAITSRYNQLVTSPEYCDVMIEAQALINSMMKQLVQSDVSEIC